MDDIIIQFARLWGNYEATRYTAKDEIIAEELKDYDSIELRNLLQQWADEFNAGNWTDDEALVTDTVAFFEYKLEEMIG